MPKCSHCDEYNGRCQVCGKRKRYIQPREHDTYEERSNPSLKGFLLGYDDEELEDEDN